MASRGLTKDDLEAGPNDNEIRARIVNDVRSTWLPQAYLDRGRADCPVIRFEGTRPICKADEAPMKVFTIRYDDARDRAYWVRETCFFCPTESHYWYHYEGGDLKRDVWLGPRRVNLRVPQGDPHNH
jgi:hypothetical protein